MYLLVLAFAPFTLTRLSSICFCAKPRVLKKRAAQSHLSRRMVAGGCFITVSLLVD